MEIKNEIDENQNATGYQYILVNGEKYYFDRKKVSEYTLNDAEIDSYRTALANDANIELSSQTYKKNDNYYISVGIMSDGNCIVHNSAGRYGVFDSFGNIVIPFIYDKIEPIMKKNGEIVHKDFYIAKRKEREIVDPKDGKKFYVGDLKSSIISSTGDEIIPFEGSKIETILYDDEKDLLHCVNSGSYNGVYAQSGYAGYSKDVVTIDGAKLDRIYEKKVDENSRTIDEKQTEQILKDESNYGNIDSKFLDDFNLFEKRYREYLTMVSGDTMHIDTNFASQLLDTSNYLLDQLNKMKDTLNKDDFIRYAMCLEQYVENLNNHLKYVNQASSIFNR